MKRNIQSIRHIMLPVLMLVLLAGCSTGSPLEKLQSSIDRYPQYSVILQDMTWKGLIFHDYFHRYRILYAEKEKQDDTPVVKEKVTDWIRVDKQTFDTYKPALGMTILSKKQDGALDKSPQPPAYQFIGDPRFGKWETDNQGNQFWKWLATSMVLSRVFDEIGDAFGKHRSTIDYRDWQEYKRHSERGAPYYGKKDNQGRPQFGTQGKVTEKSSPSFFERQQQRMEERKTGFKDKVESRMGRTKVSSGFSGKSSFGGRKR